MENNEDYTIKTTGLVVSEDTALFAQALGALNLCEDGIMSALIRYFGDKQGTNFYNAEVVDLIEALREKIGKYIVMAISDHQRYGDGQTI